MFCLWEKRFQFQRNGHVFSDSHTAGRRLVGPWPRVSLGISQNLSWQKDQSKKKNIWTFIHPWGWLTACKHQKIFTFFSILWFKPTAQHRTNGCAQLKILNKTSLHSNHSETICLSYQLSSPRHITLLPNKNSQEKKVKFLISFTMYCWPLFSQLHTKWKHWLFL